MEVVEGLRSPEGSNGVRRMFWDINRVHGDVFTCQFMLPTLRVLLTENASLKFCKSETSIRMVEKCFGCRGAVMGGG